VLVPPGTGFGGAFVALVAVVCLIAACKWTFGDSGVRRVRRRPDYGLLTMVSRTDSPEAAESVRAALADRGIRATVAPAGRGFDAQGRQWPPTACVVLVFPRDAAAAEALVRAPR
jgi:hypothetical protein